MVNMNYSTAVIQKWARPKPIGPIACDDGIAPHELHELLGSPQPTEQLIYEAKHDPLTGLDSKHALMEYLRYPHYWAPELDAQSILALLDLDGFEKITDDYGQLAGDEVLSDIAHCLKTSTRQSDRIARVGDDGFVILLAGCDLSEARRILETILARLSAYRYHRAGREYSVTASIGVTDQNIDMLEPDATLKHADQACHRAKLAGGNRIVIEHRFDVMKNIITVPRRIIPQTFLNEGHYRLYQQPIYSLRATDPTQRIDVFLRLQDQGNIILAHEFMPDVRRYDMEAELDQWVMSELANTWTNRRSVSDSRPLECFINLSRTSIREVGETIDFVRDLLSEMNLPEGFFCFNIQERYVVEYERQVVELTHKLAGLRVKFALDGVGASELYSLGYLRGFPVDYLKISAQTATRATQDRVYAAYMDALANISRVLEAPLIGVGAECHAHLQCFKQFGIAYVQGHALSAPEPFSSGWIGAHAHAACNLHSVA